MKLWLKTRNGPIEASGELIAKLSKQGKFTADTRCFSTDGGETWQTYTEVLNAAGKAPVEEIPLADYPDEIPLADDPEFDDAPKPARACKTPFNVKLLSGITPDKFFRVYVHNNAIYFIRHKAGAAGDAGKQAIAAQFGLVGVLLAALFKGKDNSEDDWKLDQMDPEALLEKHKGNRKVMITDIQQASLDPGGKFGGHGPCQGRWSMTPNGDKKWKMQLHTVEEMQTAVKVLLPTLGTVLNMNTAYDGAKGKFVKCLR